MSRLGLIVSTLLVVSVGGLTPGNARRLPEPGGQVRVALDGALRDRTEKLQQVCPLLEPAESSFEADGAYRWRHEGRSWQSRILKSVIPATAGDGWVVKVAYESQTVLQALQRCFNESESQWPARVLALLGVTAEVRSGGKDEILVSFGRPFGPFVDLMAGCAIVAAEMSRKTSPGPYTSYGTGKLKAHRLGLVPEPLIDTVEFVDANAPADIRVGQNQERTSDAVVRSPVPDVLALVQSVETRMLDPLGIGTELAPLKNSFYAVLRPSLLLQVYAAGRGMLARSLLPAAVAPIRTHVEPAVEGLGDLSLKALPEGAEQVTISYPSGDLLAKGLVERMGMMARHRGMLLNAQPAMKRGKEGPQAQVVRWRSPTRDPALAMLHFATRYLRHRFGGNGMDLSAHLDGLLAESLSLRVEAAMELEREWLAERSVVPLVSQDFWYDVDPSLLGLQITANGTLLFRQAYWSNPQ